jgi:acetyl/propionyl-CoA carboxylase alpha subunit
LNADSIIQIATNTGCNAIHPGYGFLSEDYKFVKKVIDNNLIFIGPSLDVMEKIYDKQKLKDILILLMEKVERLEL